MALLDLTPSLASIALGKWLICIVLVFSFFPPPIIILLYKGCLCKPSTASR